MLWTPSNEERSGELVVSSRRRTVIHSNSSVRSSARSQLHEWIESEEGLGHKPAFTTGLTFFGGLPHPPELVEEAEARLERMDVWELTMMQSVTMEAKSFFIGLAVVEGALTAEEAIDASRVEEEFQIEQWGLVEGGHDMDQLNNGIQIRASVVFKDMLEAGVEGGHTRSAGSRRDPICMCNFADENFYLG